MYALTTHQLQVERRQSHRDNQCMLSPHTSYRWRGERVIETIKCMRSPHTSYRWRGERVIEPIKCMRSPHTSYRWRGDRVMKPISVWGRLGGHDVHRPVENLARMPGLHPYSFTKYILGFLMTTESQDLGLTSHLKDGACWQYSVPVSILGREDPHRPQGEHPLLASLSPLPTAT